MKTDKKYLFPIIALFLASLLLWIAGCATSRPDLVWSKDHTQTGIASWYSYPFHGQRASNGEIYNMNAMTAAHPSLALNSIVEVTNRNNGKKVIVRINDRLPPNDKERIIDLSRKAAERLDMMECGIAPVTLRVITYGNNRYVPANASASDGKIYLPQRRSTRTSSSSKTEGSQKS